MGQTFIKRKSVVAEISSLCPTSPYSPCFGSYWRAPCLHCKLFPSKIHHSFSSYREVLLCLRDRTIQRPPLELNSPISMLCMYCQTGICLLRGVARNLNESWQESMVPHHPSSTVPRSRIGILRLQSASLGWLEQIICWFGRSFANLEMVHQSRVCKHAFHLHVFLPAINQSPGEMYLNKYYPEIHMQISWLSQQTAKLKYPFCRVEGLKAESKACSQHL